MWVMTTSGFFSAVAHHNDANLLVVRTRVLQDAEALASWVKRYRKANGLPGARTTLVKMVVAYQGSDYPWRVIIRRQEWSAFLVAEAEAIDFTNFKNAVTKKQGQARHNVYSTVWSALLKLEQLPGAVKDHAARAVPHPLGNRRNLGYGDWAQPSKTLGQLTINGEVLGTAEVELDIDNFPCPGCDGTGTIDGPDPGDPERTYTYNCAVCGGTGEKPLTPSLHADCTKHACVAPWDEPVCG